jgi:hypothetical protein
MNLAELEWTELTPYCKRAEPRPGLVVYWHYAPPVWYGICKRPYTPAECRWDNLEPIMAQAILYELLK